MKFLLELLLLRMAKSFHQLIMKKNCFKYIVSLIIFIQLLACSQAKVDIVKETDEALAVFPDYDGVTIPVNVAPLNFSVTAEAGDYQLCIRGTDSEINVHSEDNSFDIPLKTWRKLLSENAGQEISMRIAKKTTEGWVAYREMHVKVSAESIDPYLAYRLIPPYEQWNRMGIYQRNLESFEESPIYWEPILWAYGAELFDKKFNRVKYYEVESAIIPFYSKS